MIVRSTADRRLRPTCSGTSRPVRRPCLARRWLSSAMDRSAGCQRATQHPNTVGAAQLPELRASNEQLVRSDVQQYFR
jgi:hypothetical protein